ncbi:MAG: zinc finger MYND domain-containing protein [Oligoflexia bacterium]|nr:zinc finger MYND domain-containing protein [Oligoflexia bacterium]
MKFLSTVFSSALVSTFLIMTNLLGLISYAHASQQLSTPQEGKCNVCGKNTPQQCSRCKQVHYCSRECQARDWQNHKSICAHKSSPNKIITIGEASVNTGETTSPAQFKTKDIIFCQVGLYISYSDEGKRQFHFAHSSSETFVTDAFNAFISQLRGKRFTALIFAPANLVTQYEQNGLRDIFAHLGAGENLELIPYNFPDDEEVFNFSAKLNGETLTIEATDGTQKITKIVRLDR